MSKNNKYVPWLIFVLVCVFAVWIILRKTDEITSQSDVNFTSPKTLERVQNTMGNPEIENPSNVKEAEGKVMVNDGEYLVLKTSNDEIKFRTPFRVKIVADEVQEIPRVDQIKPNLKIKVLYNPENMIPSKITIISGDK